MENLDRIPEEDGGDLYLVNGNMMKLQDAGAGYGKGGTDESVNGNSGGNGDTDGNSDKDDGRNRKRQPARNKGLSGESAVKNNFDDVMSPSVEKGGRDETEVLELDKESG